MPSDTSLWRSPATRALIRSALREDIGSGDITTRLLLDRYAQGRAVIRAKASGRVAGLPLVACVYAGVDRRVRVRPAVRDGARVKPGDLLCLLKGPRASLLTGERTALNFLQRLSGIASLTACCADAARPYGVTILDTRKTTPGWRDLEKYAVRCGGGTNHRRGLFDAVLIKDNHLRAFGGGVAPAGQGRSKTLAAALVRCAVARARARIGRRLPIEVEVQSLEELDGAITSSVDRIMLDNLPVAVLRKAIGRIRAHRGRRIEIEISGGVKPDRVSTISRLRPDFISMGALTHSAPAFDCSMEFW